MFPCADKRIVAFWAEFVLDFLATIERYPLVQNTSVLYTNTTLGEMAIIS